MCVWSVTGLFEESLQRSNCGLEVYVDYKCAVVLVIWFNLITVWQICRGLVTAAVSGLYILDKSWEMHTRFIYATTPDTSNKASDCDYKQI